MYSEIHSVKNPLAILPPEKAIKNYTLSEYLQREERAKERHEYYNGNITKLPMARGPHNIIVANTTFALKTALKTSAQKYIALGSQQLVYLPELNFSLYPDILVVAEKPEYWDSNEVLLINPILVVEVLSKSTKKYDRFEKFAEYKTLPSFQEYLLIDTNRPHIERRFREEPDLWRDTHFKNMETTIHLKSLQCSIEMNDIYEFINFANIAQ